MLIQALLECDSLGNVYMNRLIAKGAFGKEPEIDIKNNVLSVQAPVDSQAIYLQLRDRNEIRSQSVSTTLEPEVVNQPNGWQWFQIWLGRLAVVLMVILIMFKTLLNRLRNGKNK